MRGLPFILNHQRILSSGKNQQKFAHSIKILAKINNQIQLLVDLRAKNVNLSTSGIYSLHFSIHQDLKIQYFFQFLVGIILCFLSIGWKVCVTRYLIHQIPRQSSRFPR